MDDLLIEIENKLVLELIEHSGELRHFDCLTEENIRYFDDILKFVRGNRKTIYPLLVIHPDYRLIDKWKTAIKYTLWERMYLERPVANLNIILEVIAAAAMGAYIHVMKYPFDVDPSTALKLVMKVYRLLEYND